MLQAMIDAVVSMCCCWLAVSAVGHACDAWPDRPPLWETLARFAVIVAVAMLFAVYKTWLPVTWSPIWDGALWHVDAAVHGGEPWDRLAWLRASAAIYSMDMVYWLWFPVQWFALTAATWSRSGDRVVGSWVLTWFVGGWLLASAWPSHGPAFVSPLLLADVNGRTPPLVVASMQLELIEGYRLGSVKLGQGISAFPSMHAAVCALMALWAWSWRWWCGLVLWVFAVLVAIAAVVVGWHYMVDMYAGTAVACGCWWLMGWLKGETCRPGGLRERRASGEPDGTSSRFVASNTGEIA